MVAHALALGGQVVEPQAFLAQLSGWVQAVEPSVASYIQQLAEWIDLPPGEVVVHIAPAGKTPGYADGWEGISPFVTGSVLWSLYAFLRTPDDYWATVCTAIAVGGDVDTTAADMLVTLDLELNAVGIHLAFAELTDPVKQKIVRYSLLDTIDEGHFYPTIDVAVAAFFDERTRAEQRGEEQ